ncbi:hypothetical protein MUK42_31436 [Musa troglodytarum]|uniref:Uncharacterized protein n=1 Tax=Musa troglodytarum TaxID=320322 RepID=A0A9E7IAI8_9LILI|nr:hypothetical protein MUK42_31436 [Musa troglodytarum]
MIACTLLEDSMKLLTLFKILIWSSSWWQRQVEDKGVPTNMRHHSPWRTDRISLCEIGGRMMHCCLWSRDEAKK